MSNIKVTKNRKGEEVVYKGNTKAVMYKVKGVAKPMIAEELDAHIVKLIGDGLVSAKDLEVKLGIGTKKISLAMSRLYQDGLIQSKLVGNRMHYYKAPRCLLQDILHPLPKYIIKSTTKYTEKWFIKRLCPENYERKPRGQGRDKYKKYGD